MNFTYSLTNDFNGQENIAEINAAIKNNDILRPLYNTISRSRDIITVSFTEALDLDQQNELWKIIKRLILGELTKKTIKNITLAKNTNIKTTYTTIGSFYYNPFEDIKEIIISSRGTNYSIRIYDFTNNKTIIENTYTNDTDFSTKVINKIYNQPITRSLFEIQLKNNSLLALNGDIRTIQLCE